jgi:hypothetical protein
MAEAVNVKFDIKHTRRTKHTKHTMEMLPSLGTANPIETVDIEIVDIEIDIPSLPQKYQQSLMDFMGEHKIKPPGLDTLRGIALRAMMCCQENGKWFDRASCKALFERYGKNTDDAIQPFNKLDQLGISQIKNKKKGVYRIKFPLELSPKLKMRRGFKTDECKHKEIERIKQIIRTDYVDEPNSKWQLGHKHPLSGDNSCTNMVLQPPIQAKYRDEYIFIDTLTKIPTVQKLQQMCKQGKSPYTTQDFRDLKDWILTLELGS